jgi:hypothetical protein
MAAGAPAVWGSRPSGANSRAPACAFASRQPPLPSITVAGRIEKTTALLAAGVGRPGKQQASRREHRNRKLAVMLYDAFICHASEDKADFVRPWQSACGRIE